MTDWSELRDSCAKIVTMTLGRMGMWIPTGRCLSPITNISSLMAHQIVAGASILVSERKCGAIYLRGKRNTNLFLLLFSKVKYKSSVLSLDWREALN